MIIKKLNVIYYLIYTLIILFTIVGYIFNYNGLFYSVPENNFLNTYLPYLFIFLSLICLVFGFIFFELNKSKIRNIKNEWEQNRKYIQIAGFRLYLVGFTLVVGVPVFYISYNVMVLYCIGVSAVLLLLCKPTENKIMNDLNKNTDTY